MLLYHVEDLLLGRLSNLLYIGQVPFRNHVNTRAEQGHVRIGMFCEYLVQPGVLSGSQAVPLKILVVMEPHVKEDYMNLDALLCHDHIVLIDSDVPV